MDPDTAAARAIETIFANAVAHHQAGRLDQAEAHYREVLAHDGRHAASLHNLGVIAQQRGDHEGAIELVSDALRVRENDPFAHNTLGEAHRAQGQSKLALGCYDRALALKPDYVAALHNRGLALRAFDRFEEAAASQSAALVIEPTHIEALVELGDALCRLERVNEAIVRYQSALALQPDHTAARNNLGLALASQDRFDEALTHHRAVLSIRPESFESHANLGLILQCQGSFVEALSHYEAALAINAGRAEIHHGRGVTLRALGRFSEAVASLRTALDLHPGVGETYGNLGAALHSLGKLDEAIQHYEAALALEPGLAKVHASLGAALEGQGRLEAAAAEYEQALRLDADFADAHMFLGMLFLLRGAFFEGWPEYEWRRARKALTKRAHAGPMWDGSDLGGRTIQLESEQGLGDTIQFVRYAPMVAARNGHVIVACQQPLVRLLKSARGVSDVVEIGAEQPKNECWAPLLSLPRLFQTDVETIPSGDAYLKADSKAAYQWKRRLVHHREFKVGVVWRGNPVHINDHNRSLSASQIAAVFDGSSLLIVSLQKDARPEELAALGANVFDAGPHLGDFADTAALIANLDLVISVDTAVAHLAGALGAQVWTLIPFAPDWRWQLGRTDSPWYPTMRLFRQPELGDWASVVASVRTQLGQITSRRDLRPG